MENKLSGAVTITQLIENATSKLANAYDGASSELDVKKASQKSNANQSRDENDLIGIGEKLAKELDAFAKAAEENPDSEKADSEGKKKSEDEEKTESAKEEAAETKEAADAESKDDSGGEATSETEKSEDKEESKEESKDNSDSEEKTAKNQLFKIAAEAMAVNSVLKEAMLGGDMEGAYHRFVARRGMSEKLAMNPALRYGIAGVAGLGVGAGAAGLYGQRRLNNYKNMAAEAFRADEVQDRQDQRSVAEYYYQLGMQHATQNGQGGQTDE